MSGNELATPIRLYWDVGPDSELTLADYQRIALQTVENRFLSLQLTETAPVISEACLTILETLQDKPVALSLVAFPSALDSRSLGMLRHFPLKVLFAAVRAQSDLDEVLRLQQIVEGKPLVGLSFSVTQEGFEELPGVLAWCVEKGIEHLLLPMQRLVLGESCFSPRTADLERLAVQLGSIIRPERLKITIHDPFLWKTFFPSQAFPGGGCQAANTMLYISPKADVYPCPLVPILIGDLRSASLRDVIRSSVKKEARRRILAAARQCAGCREQQNCKGGCRGRSLTLKGSLEGPDPSCPYA